MNVSKVFDKNKNSKRLIVRMAGENVAMFRFLLEAYENLAIFTVIEKRPALLMVIFAAESKKKVIETLENIALTLPLTWEEWPFDQP